MRKSLVYLFLLLANIILLAHNAIPHHHHHAQICVDKGHCHAHESHSGDETGPADDHRHDRDPLSTECILKQDIIRPSNNWKPDTGDTPSGYAPDLLTLLADDAIIHSKLPDCRTIFSHGVLLSSYTFFESTSGLRAPPLV